MRQSQDSLGVGAPTAILCRFYSQPANFGVLLSSEALLIVDAPGSVGGCVSLQVAVRVRIARRRLGVILIDRGVPYVDKGRIRAIIH